MGDRCKKDKNCCREIIMSEDVKVSSCFDIKIYIDRDGNVTITSLFKELLPLVRELSYLSGNREEGNEHCS